MLSSQPHNVPYPVQHVPPNVVSPQQVVPYTYMMYTWPPDAIFELTGHQFGMWLNSVRALVNTKEALTYKFAFEANDIIESIVAKGVEEGAIVEAEQQPDQPTNIN